jgi:predicted transcriptional regulator
MKSTREKATMDMIPLNPERRAQLEEYAKRRGQDPVAARDDALATYLEWERQDFAEAVEGIRRGHEDVKAGNTRPATEFLADMRRKHDGGSRTGHNRFSRRIS